jgi:DNA-binding IclR family transcriptional regulator
MQFESILHDEWPEEQTDTHIDNRDPLSNLLALARKRSVSFVLGCHAEGRIAIGDCWRKTAGIKIGHHQF